MQLGITPAAGPPEQRSTSGERRYAAIRSALGLAAPTTALCLLVWTGPSLPTLAAVAVAGLLVVTSKLLFRGRDA